jgi:N-acylneuraminate cytidylyltransferase
MTATGERREILALIPARGGSKSIPRKNLLPIAGKPLIAYSIAHALGSRYVTRTIVSTDDAEIAQAARDAGAEVPFLRPSEFAQDFSPDLDVFRHALEWLRDRQGYHSELVVHLRPTGPVRRVAVIDRAIEVMLSKPEADSLRSVSLPTETPYKMWRVVGDCLEPLLRVPGMTESYCAPRQALPEVYWQNGYVDIVRPRVILEDGLMCGRTIAPFVIEEPIFEIDYADSVPRVEAALAALQLGTWPRTDWGGKRHPV